MKFLLTLLWPVFQAITKLLISYQKRTGLLPMRYFFAVSFLSPSPAFELLVLRRNGEDVEVFLSQREQNDPFWPSEWHHPGTVLRNGDTHARAQERLAHELGLPELPGTPKLVEILIADRIRGAQVNMIHLLWVAPETEFSTGKFFPLKHLPQHTIDFHKAYLEAFDPEKLA